MSSSTAFDRRGALSALVAALAASGVVMWLLYAFIPYATGYGDQRVTILHFASRLWEGEDWQHCYLVPLAFAGMIYWQRERFKLEDMRGSALAGLPVLMGALLVYWVGFRADNVYVGYFSFQILTGGLILWFFGWHWASLLAVPWLFLFFLYPLPFLDNIVAFPLRMVMSEASVATLNFLGVGAIKTGTGILSAPDLVAGLKAGQRFSVDVADPCSGIRSLFALMMVSTLYGYFSLKKGWQRVILFLCSIPLAVIGNLVRILMLTFGVIAMGPALAIGTLEKPSFFHMLAGYLVFAVALAGMLGAAWALNADWKQIFGKTRAGVRRATTASPASAGKTRQQKSQDEY